MRVALAQVNPVVGDVSFNRRVVSERVEAAHMLGADLVVFPELVLTGYPPRDLLLREDFVRMVVGEARGLVSDSPSDMTVVFGVPLPVEGWGEVTGRRGGGGKEEGEGVGLGCGGGHGGLYNSLVVCREGRMVEFYDKRLLPTYDVFDEARYFAAGDRAVVLDVAGIRVGLSVCEDLWRAEDVGRVDRYRGEVDPIAELVGKGASLIVNASASPFVIGKNVRHRELLARHAKRHGVFVACVNQVGANDDLVFDGHSVVVGPDGAAVATAPGFAEHLLLVDLERVRGSGGDGGGGKGDGGGRVSLRMTGAGPGDAVIPPRADPDLERAVERHVYDALVLGLRDYFQKSGFRSALLGLSGGIDSAVCAVLACAALGAGRVHPVALPSMYSSDHSREDAQELAGRLGMRLDSVPISGAYRAMLDALGASAGLGLDVGENGVLRGSIEEAGVGLMSENLQSRLRGMLLMAMSNRTGSLLITTGNKSELAVGYCTLYGDMCGAIGPLSDLTKTRVYALARWMNANVGLLGLRGVDVGELERAGGVIPERTVVKPPSAELRPNQTDQDSLPEYAVLDEIIERYVERGEGVEEIERGMGAAVVGGGGVGGGGGGREGGLVRWVVSMIDRSEYKRRQMAVGLKVSPVAFGPGRRYPVVWRGASVSVGGGGVVVKGGGGVRVE